MNDTPNWSEDELDMAWERFLAGKRSGPFALDDPGAEIVALHTADVLPDPDPDFVTRTRVLVTHVPEPARADHRTKSHQLGFVYAPRSPFPARSLLHYAIAVAVALFLIGVLSIGTVLFQESNGRSAIASAIATNTSQPTAIPTMSGSAIDTE